MLAASNTWVDACEPRPISESSLLSSCYSTVPDDCFRVHVTLFVPRPGAMSYYAQPAVRAAAVAGGGSSNTAKINEQF